MPQVKEIFFDDDTLTDNRPRVEELAVENSANWVFGKPGFGMTWSCNAKANVPYETLKVMKRRRACGLLLVGYESGNQQILHNIKKGLRTDVARQFTRDCHKPRHRHPRHLHPRASRAKPLETIEETINYAKEIDPHTIQVSALRRRIRARSCTIRRWRTTGSMAPIIC